MEALRATPVGSSTPMDSVMTPSSLGALPGWGRLWTHPAGSPAPPQLSVSPLWLPWRPCSPRRRSCQGSSALGAGSRHPQVGASLPGPPNRRVAPLREGLPPCSLLLLVGDRTSLPPSCPCVRSPSENAEHFLEPHSLLSLRNSLAKMGFSIFTLQMRKPRPRRGKLTSLTSKRQSEVSTQDCLNNRKLHSS